MLNTGRASPEQIRGWVANRFYYQISIPIKDAAILSNCPDRAVRRNWVQRILDHDGHGEDPGGIESWLRLAEAVGLARAQVESLSQVLPGVRFAVDAYVNFARRAPVAGGRLLLADRAVRAGDPQAAPGQLARSTTRGSTAPGLHYFQSRVSLARRDVEFGLALHARALQHARRAGARARDPAVQARRALADERCDGAALRSARRERRHAPSTRPRGRRSARGFRLQWEAAQQALRAAVSRRAWSS